MKRVTSIKGKKNNMDIEIDIIHECYYPSSKEIYFCEIIVNKRKLLHTKPISKDLKIAMENINSIRFAISELGVKINNKDKELFNFFKDLYYQP